MLTRPLRWPFTALLVASLTVVACTNDTEPEASADPATEATSEGEASESPADGSADTPPPAVLPGSPAEQAAQALAEEGSGAVLAGDRLQGRLAVAAGGVTAPPIGEPAAAVMICDTGLQCPGGCSTGNCVQLCRSGSTCTFTCEGGTCAQTCELGARCEFSCAGGRCLQSCPLNDCTAACEGGGCVAQLNTLPSEGSGEPTPP